MTMRARISSWFRREKPRVPEYRDGTEPIPLRTLVSPLRYDVLVRKAFFELLAANRELALHDVDAFVGMVESTSYRVWFDRVFCRRFAPHLLDDPHAHQKAFRRRILRSVRLHETVWRDDVPREDPITIHTALEVCAADSGKRVTERFFIGDGCHRLALLLLAGKTELPRGAYRIEVAPRFVPLDNTVLLLPALDLGEAEYARFLSSRYAEDQHHSVASLLREVQVRAPDRLEELHAVLDVDLPLVGRVRGAARPGKTSAER
jgi:hypothetical protein